jgi:manganese transport system substrate-binding protein
MKKTIFLAVAVIAILVLIFIWSGESKSKIQSTELSSKPVALSTFTIISDMVGEVGGDKIEAISLTKPGAEIHGYEVTPSDLIQASRASVIFENGMNLELWTEKLKASIPDVPIITVSEGVQVRDISEDAYAGKPNPHAWMSPEQGLVYVENIRRELTVLLPEHAEYFANNASAYSDKIRAVDTQLESALSTLWENNRILVTCEGAFSYLTNDYGLEEVYLWAINSESMGTPRQVAKVIETVREKEIPAVFCESTVEPRIMQEIIAATDASLGGVLYVDSLSPIDGPASTYITLLEHTANTIISGLTNNQ